MTQPELRIYTYRTGLLSRLGHDLQLTLRTFSLELAAGAVTGSFDLNSVRVEAAVVGGGLDPNEPAAKDKAEIERTLAREILHTQTHPLATLAGEVIAGPSNFRLRAELTLHGQTQPLQAEIEASDRLRSSVRLVPSRWGIKPYKALGGALKVQDLVKVEFSLPIDVPGFDLAHWQEAHCTWSGKSGAS